MTERRVFALWAVAALLLAVVSGATTFAVLTDEETVSVEISASDDGSATDESTIGDESATDDGTAGNNSSADAQGAGDDGRESVRSADPGGTDLRDRAVATNRGGRP